MFSLFYLNSSTNEYINVQMIIFVAKLKQWEHL